MRYGTKLCLKVIIGQIFAWESFGDNEKVLQKFHIHLQSLISCMTDCCTSEVCVSLNCVTLKLYCLLNSWEVVKMHQNCYKKVISEIIKLSAAISESISTFVYIWSANSSAMLKPVYSIAESKVNWCTLQQQFLKRYLQVNNFWKEKTLLKTNFWYQWIIHSV